MYFNDIHMLYYLIFGIAGIIIGQFTDWCSQRLAKHKKVFSKELWTEYIRYFKPNYLLMSITGIIYVLLFYFIGIQTIGIMYNIDLIKYTILTPLLIMAFIIDINYKIIPNRLSLTIFELGLIFTFIYGTFNINLAIDMLARNVNWWSYFYLNSFTRKSIIKKRGYGTWRCQINDWAWTLLWSI